MMSSSEEVVAQKKEAIEAAMDMFEKGAEVLASAVGESFPLCEAAAPVSKSAMDNVHSKEVFYVKEQFSTVRNKSDVLSSQMEDIESELKKSNSDRDYFSVEENIRNQFRKYIDILEAKPQFREVKKKSFLDHFAKTGGDKNLYVLYDASMGTNSLKDPILDTVERYVARNRRSSEDFCVRMKELFCSGLIASSGHCALTSQSQEEEQDKIQEWSTKIEEVESKMKASIESCIAAFPEQAKLDMQRLSQEKEEGNLQEAAQQLSEFSEKKYDWVSWSVRSINHSGSTYRNSRAGKHFHHVAGQNWFEVLQVNNISSVVSFSTEPQPVPREDIRQSMEASKRAKAPEVVEALENRSNGFIAHAISRHKESAAAFNFPEECHYWELHKNVVVCVHSE